MRQLQKGDQGPRQRDHRRIHLASVLILQSLRKANYRVPEETQASSVQDDRIAAPSGSSPNNRPRLTRSFSFRLLLNELWREQCSFCSKIRLQMFFCGRTHYEKYREKARKKRATQIRPHGAQIGQNQQSRCHHPPNGQRLGPALECWNLRQSRGCLRSGCRVSSAPPPGHPRP